jgi:PAS domain S-box-containing protein
MAGSETGLREALEALELERGRRERAEAALNCSQCYRQVFDLATDMIVVQDIETGEIIDINAEASRATGYSRRELIEMGVAGWSPTGPDYAPERVMAHLAAAAAGEPQLFEWAYVDRDGALHPTEVHLRRADLNHEPRLLAVVRDIGNRKQRDHEQRCLERRLLEAQKLESLGVLAGGIAHDFNNLLMGVLGNATLALEAMSRDAPGRSEIVGIEQTARQMADLAQQMLAYSGRGRFVVEPVDLEATVRKALPLLKQTIRGDARLELDLAPEACRLRGDISQIRQILVNLVKNASEALDGGAGVIRVRTRLLPPEELANIEPLTEWAPPGGACCCLEVNDDGHGLSGLSRKQIFEPFVSTRPGGRGLGLAAVLGIVRGHEGTITVDSEPGLGTRVRVLFPEEREEVPEDRISSGHPLPFEGKGTVLVVDDEPVVRMTVSRYAERMGLQAMTAADGPEAIRVFSECGDTIDLVLLDMTMPGMDGRETLVELRSIRPDVPVLLSSGYSEEEALSAFENIQLAGFLQKPYSIDELASTLRRTLPVRS